MYMKSCSKLCFKQYGTLIFLVYGPSKELKGRPKTLARISIERLAIAEHLKIKICLYSHDLSFKALKRLVSQISGQDGSNVFLL